MDGEERQNVLQGISLTQPKYKGTLQLKINLISPQKNLPETPTTLTCCKADNTTKNPNSLIKSEKGKELGKIPMKALSKITQTVDQTQ